MLGSTVAVYAEKHAVWGWKDNSVGLLVQENLQKNLQKIEKKTPKFKKMLGLTFFSKILIHLNDHLDWNKVDWDMLPPNSV